MGVDLKVHVYKGFLIAKASWVPTWDPAKVFFEFVKIFFGKRNGEHSSWWGGLRSLISYFPRWSENLMN